MNSGRGTASASVSRLAEACLRISASLDEDTVLREVVEAGRELTGAKWGGIVPAGGRDGLGSG